MRVVGPNGIAEPLTLTVGNVSEIPEVEPNHTLEQAQKISVPVVINGVVQARDGNRLVPLRREKG